MMRRSSCAVIARCHSALRCKIWTVCVVLSVVSLTTLCGVWLVTVIDTPPTVNTMHLLVGHVYYREHPTPPRSLSKEIKP